MPQKPNRFRKVAEEAARKTNDKLLDDLARLTRLTDAQLSKLLPEKEDKENLAKLLAVVGSATTQNQKVAALRSNFETLGPVVMKVLRLLV